MRQRHTDATLTRRQCVPETHLRPHNTPRFGAGTRGKHRNGNSAQMLANRQADIAIPALLNLETNSLPSTLSAAAIADIAL